MALELVSVGVNHYRSDRYVDLKNAVRDAARVAAYFENSLPAGSRFHTRLLENPAALEVGEALMSAQRALVDDESILVFYFAGHALQERDGGKQWLLCSDAFGSLADGGDGSGALSTGYIHRFKAKCRGKLLFIYDACRIEPLAGRAIDSGQASMSGFRDVSPTPQTGVSVAQSCALFSCGDRERASDDGTFSNALIQTIRRRVDRREEVIFDDVFLRDLTSLLRQNNRRQTPERSGRPFILVPGLRAGAIFKPVVAQADGSAPESANHDAVDAASKLIGEAEAAYLGGRYEEAERFALRALEFVPDNPRAKSYADRSREMIAEKSRRINQKFPSDGGVRKPSTDFSQQTSGSSVGVVGSVQDAVSPPFVPYVVPPLEVAPPPVPSRVPRGFFDAVGMCYSKYFNVRGRASKKEYWLWWIYHWLLVLPFVAVAIYGLVNDDYVLQDAAEGIGLLFYFFVLLSPSVCLLVRRLHDINRPGWWVLAYILLIVATTLTGGLVAGAILGCLDGTDGDNQYGEKPSEVLRITIR